MKKEDNTLNSKDALLNCFVLTYNEEKHIKRCLSSLLLLNVRIVVIDSYSTDATVSIVEKLGVEVYQNPFINHTKQIEWALEHCNIKSQWVFRLDADEFITEDLANWLNHSLATISDNISGILIRRRVHFMSKWIKHGGYYPIWILRIWKIEKASIENRWMDEYIQINSGETLSVKYDFIEENLNNLAWWTEKHNAYSSRELADFIRWKYLSVDHTSNIDKDAIQLYNQRMKWGWYYKLPPLIRPFFYFIYRYFFKLGFLDGKEGLIWHFLQGFWFRFLVDAKYLQLKHISKKNNEPIKESLYRELGIKI